MSSFSASVPTTVSAAVSNSSARTPTKEAIMPEYQFRFSKQDGKLHLQTTETCAGDASAFIAARKIIVPGGADHFRVEIWRAETLVYDGVPSGWPFRHVRSDNSPGRAV
jgi:hypothetical protein